MLKQITMMESGTIRGLLISMVGVIGLVLSLFGVDAAVFGQEANKFIDALMSLLASGGLAYAGYARTMNATPPLSDTAADKTREMARKQGGHAATSLLATLTLVFVGMFSYGCVTEQARGFTDRAATAELLVNSTIKATTNALNDGAIKADDAKVVRELTGKASDLLLAAETAFGAGDPTTAEGRLALAEGILRELQQRLKPKQVRSQP